MRVLLSAVVLFFIVWSSAAAGQQQYTEATCLLLQQQIERFAGQPQNHYYLQARRDFNQHCQNPIAAPAKQLVLSNVPTKKVAPTTAASLASEPEVLTARPENTAAALVKFDMGAMLFSLFQPSIPYIVIFLLALILLPFFFLWFFGNQRQFLGAMAERQLHRVLLHRLPAGYQHYRNLILQTSQGDLTEIDHLVLSRFGIFVVEVKNYRGWIFGSEQQPYWTVQYFRRKHSFQNPLRQNYKHTEAVKFALGLTLQQSKHVFSVVAFSERAELKTTLPD